MKNKSICKSLFIFLYEFANKNTIMLLIGIVYLFLIYFFQINDSQLIFFFLAFYFFIFAQKVFIKEDLKRLFERYKRYLSRSEKRQNILVFSVFKKINKSIDIKKIIDKLF